MSISEKQLAANRRNIELGREKAKEAMHRLKEKNHKLVEYTGVCEHCHQIFNKMIKHIDMEKGRVPRFCSRSCANSRIRTAAIKQKISNTLLYRSQTNTLARCNPVTCKLCGQIIPYKLAKNHRVFCSQECRIQYQQCRRTSKSFTSRILYKNACRFLFDVYKYPTEFDLALIQQYGWYSPKNKHDNPDGVSRDHMYSVSMGFKNHVPPHLLAHPANCQILLQKDNFKKLGKCSITLDELKERIRLWDEKYGTYVPYSHK